MTDRDKIRQNISAFMDAEDELDSLLENDDHRCWERYHIISEAIKNNTPALMTHTVAAKVSQSLEGENLILAPANIKSSPFKTRGFAIAASLTGALALGSVVWLQGTNNNSAVSVRFADTSNLSTHFVMKNGEQIERLTDPRLNAYITQHDASILKRQPAHASQVRIVSFPE